MPSRAFIAFDLPDPALDLLGSVREAFVVAAPAWKGERWVPAELQHVTVKFVGALDDDAVADACGELVAVAAAFAPLSLRLDGIRAVRSTKRATMLWAELGGEVERCADLASRVDALLAARFGVDADERAFRPHVTLVRSRRPRRVPTEALEAARAVLGAGNDSDRIVSVPSLTLYSSTLSRTGPTYVALAEFPLRG